MSALDKAQAAEAKLGRWIDSWNPYNPAKLSDKGLKPVEVEESDIRRGAARWFMGFFAVFILWATLAPIDAGVTVQGTVSVLGNRKAIQHPSGGVVQEIMVKEGAQVEEGQVLLRINPQRLIRHRARCDFPVPAKASTTCNALVDSLILRSTKRCSSSKPCISAVGIAWKAESSSNNAA